MKLQFFNAENSSRIQRAQPRISIDFKDGVFRIFRTAAERMGLTAKGHVAIAFDEQEERWYIFKTNESGFALRDYGVSGALGFNCTSLAKKIADFMSYTKNSGYCIVGSEPVVVNKVNYYPLIVETLKNDY